MANSTITKKALSLAFKELMNTEPYTKISIGDICERCGMHRKSFYYHFRDKEDLVNYIFHSEFFDLTIEKQYENLWMGFEELAEYLYENRVFYRKVLKVEGENSFIEHFRKLCYPHFYERISKIVSKGDPTDFKANFFTDALIAAIRRWLLDRNCMSPKEFIEGLKSCVGSST